MCASIDTTINSSGTETVSSGGLASGATVNAGGTQSVLSGGSAVGTTVNSAGTQTVASGGTAIDTVISSGGVQNVISGATIVDADVLSGGVQNVISGGAASAATISAGGTQTVTSGTAYATTVSSGGSLLVNTAGLGVDTVLRGGTLAVSLGGTTSGTTVNSGSTETLSSGGTASGTTVNSGGTQSVLGGGTAYATTINSGGLQYVDGVIEGYAYNATVNSGGTQEVAFGGYASGTLVNSGGLQTVDPAGAAVDTTLAGGTQIVSSGGSVTATLVTEGGTEDILAGGYASGTTVSSGTVIVDGTATNLSVGSGASVTGTGTVASDLTLTSGSTLVASTLGSGLKVDGTLNFESSSTYHVSVNAAGLSGVTAVVGNVIINGASLTLTANAGSYSAGARYTILTYTGTESGSFSAVNADFAYLTPAVSYAAGVIAVTLDATQAFRSSGFAAAASTINQRNVASALTRTYDAGGNALTAALVTASNAQAVNALTQTSGDEAAVFRQIAEQRTWQAQDVIAQRLAGGTQAAPSNTGNDLWVSADYSYTHESGDDTSGSGAYQDHSANLTVGYDRAVSPALRVGAALAVNDDTEQFSGRSANARSDGMQALLYGAWAPPSTSVYVNGMVGAGYWDNALTRSLQLGTLSGTADGSLHTTSVAAYVETGLQLASSFGIWEPYAGLRAGHYAQQGFAETGGGVFDLDYAAANSNAVSSLLGVRLLKGAGVLFSHPLSWQADLAWEHQLGSTTQSVSAAFADAPAQTYQVFGTPSDRDAARLGMGASWQPTNRTTVFARVAAEVGSHARDYGVTAGAQWKW
jgi:autotransporter passenger strand-loop-strand repeat protein